MAKSLSAADMLGRTHRQPETAPIVRVAPPSPPGDQAASRLVTERYQKASAFLTPDQRRWLKATARGLPEGLSASDLVRLALDQLRAAVEDGLPLVETLITRAHADAERFTGRRNRGLPVSD